MTLHNSIDSVIAASFPAYPGIGDNISFIVVGFGFVVFVLAVLALITSGIGSGMKRIDQKAEAAQKASTPAAPTPTAAAPAEIGPFAGHSNPDHIPAVIAAAVHVALRGRRHRIRGVRPANEGRWAQEGRRDIFSSHRIR